MPSPPPCPHDPPHRPPGGTRCLGASGEALVCRVLAAQGCHILDRNWRTRYGELDLVVREADTVVAIEVKTRRSLRFGQPLGAVDATKARRLRRLFAMWLNAHPVSAARVRIDVIAVTVFPDQAPRLQRIRGLQ